MHHKYFDLNIHGMRLFWG